MYHQVVMLSACGDFETFFVVVPNALAAKCGLPNLIKGNVGLIFTKADLKEVLEEVAKYKVRVKMLKENYLVVTAAKGIGSSNKGVGEGLLKGLKKKPAHKSSKARQLIAAGNTADANDILTIKLGNRK
ncbi:hypothetical protein Tco_1530475 [Tanacetum coccineum]